MVCLIPFTIFLLPFSIWILSFKHFMTSLQHFVYFPSEIVFTFLKHFFASFHVFTYFPSPFAYLPSLYFYFPSEVYILLKIGWILIDNKKAYNRMEWLCWIIEWSLLKSCPKLIKILTTTCNSLINNLQTILRKLRSIINS